MNYKLIKYELNDEGFCTIPCPYGRKCAVYSEDCIHCNDWKGTEPDHIKCSFEYNHSPKKNDYDSTSEIKTGKAMSSDCGSCKNVFEEI
jgi:hypothetical protein